MNTQRASQIAIRQRFPPPLPESLVDERRDPIIIRYDGKKIDDTDLFYAIIAVDDIAKIPENLIPLSEESVNNEDAFFCETLSGICLYLETETHQNEILKLYDFESDDVVVLRAIGDLKAMGAPDHMIAPDRAAFEENFFRRVPVSEGIQWLNDRRQHYMQESTADDDTSLHF